MLRRLWRRVRRYLVDHGPELALVIFIVTFLVVLFRKDMFISIGPGHYGVMWRRFAGGTDTTHTFGEGIHVIFPWNKMYIFDGRLQLIEQKLDVLSSDGLHMEVDIAYRFELIPEEIPTLAKYVGPNYQKIVVSPEVGAQARDVFSRNTPEEIFSERREEIGKTMAAGVQADLDKLFRPPWRRGQETHFIKFWDVLVRGITLPPAVAAAIERKNEAKQNNQAYDYRLLSEAKEAERKEIEAHGIKQFQDIVAPGLTDNYLRWQGIQATEALANSRNSKIVVIGSGKGGLPLILGGMDEGKSAPGDTAATPPEDPALARKMELLPLPGTEPKAPSAATGPSKPEGQAPAEDGPAKAETHASPSPSSDTASHSGHQAKTAAKKDAGTKKPAETKEDAGTKK